MATQNYIILFIYYVAAGQNNLYEWVRDHRVHHKYTDTDADPHNSNRGFFFSHVGWLMMKKHPDVIQKGRQIDMSDILADPITAFGCKYINPTENKFVAFVALGEGWHNYHHVFPWDYKAAKLGNYTLNLTTMFIDAFSKIGWAYDLKQPSEELVRTFVMKKGDRSHSLQSVSHPNSKMD
ncbi:acyl-CoA desaturase 1-like [Nylanderia fulva]|uniref:acyl-CoA desaturase 1-like n=1 Tax=Nylanderia fulva TaxID=613905 RepID=UPI0010FBB196|nr:acyl-CoA desaturase 1-like [Nylanderia fulva]